MSFSSEIKEELAALPLDRKCCAMAELAGVLLAAGSLQLSRNGAAVEISTENAPIARRVCDLIELLYGDIATVEQHERRRLNGLYSYRVVVAEDTAARRLLADSGMLRSKNGIKSVLIRRNCCRNAMLRGLFLGCGTMVDPQKSYQIELIFTGQERAFAVLQLLHGCSVAAKQIQRKQYDVVYLKEGEQVSVFLILIGAHNAVLRFEDVRAMRELRNSVNRRTNCETANTDKTVNAASRQRKAIDRLIELGIFPTLSQDLQETAQARMDEPDSTLQQLADALNMSKSGVNHRLKKLVELGESSEFDEESGCP